MGLKSGNLIEPPGSQHHIIALAAMALGIYAIAPLL